MISKLEVNKINQSEAVWREHVVCNVLFGSHTINHLGSFPYIHKAVNKNFFQILLIIMVKHWPIYNWLYH